MNKNIQILIKTALKEDIGPSDITTESTLKKDKTIEAHITSNQDGTLCGIDIAKKVFETLDKNITFKKQANDTEKIKANQTIAKLNSPELSRPPHRNSNPNIKIRRTMPKRRTP